MELIVALAILSLVAGAVAWNVHGMLPGMHLRAATRRLLEDCSGARFAALKENRRHVLAFCFSLDGTEWEWVVFRDDDADSRRGPGEPVLLRTSLSDLGYARLDMSRCRLPRNADGVQVVVFDGRGMTVSPTGGFVSSSLYFVSSLGQELRVQFSQAGGVWINPGG